MKEEETKDQIAFDLERRYFFYPKVSKNEIGSNTKTWENPIDFEKILNDIGFKVEGAKLIREGVYSYTLRVYYLPKAVWLESKGENLVKVLNEIVRLF
jgi:hypothetical protein